MAKMTDIIGFLKSLKIPAHNQILGPGDLSGHQRRSQGQRCHGVAHERHQNARNWAAPWAPPSTLKSKGKKKKKTKKALVSGLKPMQQPSNKQIMPEKYAEGG